MATLSKISSLRSFTLIETLLAMIILLIISSFSVLIFTNIIFSNDHELRTIANIELSNTITNDFLTHDFSNKTIKSNNITIEQSLNKYKNSDIINILILKAFNENNKLLQTKQFLIINE